ncbi:hypothetical protein Tco_0476335 [Tanacetum coccineum]
MDSDVTRDAAANDKASRKPKEVQEDPDEMTRRNHDTPISTSVLVEEPSSFHRSKRIRQMDSLIEVITTKMNQEAAIKKKTEMVICELSIMSYRKQKKLRFGEQ